MPGPGLTNSLTGIGEALLDSSPIVGIVTDVDRRPGPARSRSTPRRTPRLLRPICKGVFEVRHQAQIPTVIHDAFRLARTGEPGPVAVVLPYNFLNEVWDYDGIAPPPYPSRSTRGRIAGPSACSRIAGPVGIYAGMGCLDVGPNLACAAELLQAPVATSVSGKGAIPDAHPLAVGWGYGAQGTRAAERAFKEVDVVLAFGVKYSENSTASYAIPKHDKVIHVDASAANIGRNVPGLRRVHADSRLFFARLVGDADAIRRPANPGLIRRIGHNREVDRRENGKVRITEGVDPMTFLLGLRSALGPDELIFVDVTAATHWASEGDRPGRASSVLHPREQPEHGLGDPCALGAQRVRPDRMVAAISGDGCFLMSALEMSTAARAGLPVKFFVLDDGAYHYMQMFQETAFRRTTATDLARVDFEAYARAMAWLQPDSLQRRDLRRLGPRDRLPRADPDPGHRELRRPRDPLARRGEAAYIRHLSATRSSGWPRGSPRGRWIEGCERLMAEMPRVGNGLSKLPGSMGR